MVVSGPEAELARICPLVSNHGKLISIELAIDDMIAMISFQMRDLQHENLARFVGLCLQPKKVYILTEYCPKGLEETCSYH